MENDQNPEETATSENSNGTEQGKATPEETSGQPAVTVEQFAASQKEAVRLLNLLKENGIDPKTGKKAEAVKETPADPKLEEIVTKKVQETVAPLIKSQEQARMDQWLNKHPDSYDHLAKITELFQDTPGKTIEEKMENAYLIARKEAAREQGKREMAFTIYQREQAVSSGGGASISSGESLPILTEDERKVARALGVKEEAYAKRKTK